MSNFSLPLQARIESIKNRAEIILQNGNNQTFFAVKKMKNDIYELETLIKSYGDKRYEDGVKQGHFEYDNYDTLEDKHDN